MMDYRVMHVPKPEPESAGTSRRRWKKQSDKQHGQRVMLNNHAGPLSPHAEGNGFP